MDGQAEQARSICFGEPNQNFDLKKVKPRSRKNRDLYLKAKANFTKYNLVE